jgi:hypothetical protein
MLARDWQQVFVPHGRRAHSISAGSLPPHQATGEPGVPTGQSAYKFDVEGTDGSVRFRDLRKGAVYSSM